MKLRKSLAVRSLLFVLAATGLLFSGSVGWAAEPGAIYTIFGTHNFTSPSDSLIYQFEVDIRIDQFSSPPPGSFYEWVLTIVFSDSSFSEGAFQWNSGVKQAKWAGGGLVGGSTVSFDWQVGQWYRYRVLRVGQNPNGSWRWEFSALNYSTSQETFIGYVDSNGQFMSATQTPRVSTRVAGVACTDPSVEVTWRNPVYWSQGAFGASSLTASYINSTCTNPNNTNQWLVSPSPEWKHKTNTPRTTSEGTILWAVGPQGGGTFGFKPHFQPGQEITNAVAIRYKFRVNQMLNRSAVASFKIIFTGLSLYHPNNTTYSYPGAVQANIITRWYQYTDPACNLRGQPPPGQPIFGQPGLWVSVADYPTQANPPRPSLIGVRPSNKQMFPRRSGEADSTPGLTLIETISQMDITGKDISIHIYRGNLLDPATEGLSDWGYRFQRDPQNPNITTCEPDLLSGYTYRKWHAEAVIDGITYRWDFVFPDDSARYLAPWEIMGIVTEFLAAPGFLQVYFWDFEVQREGSSTWEPLNTWKVHYRADPEPPYGLGAKIGTYNNRPVLEISNDGTDTYYKLNDVFQIPSSFPTPALFRVERATGNVFTDGSFNPGGADIAERIDVSESVEPGDVVELDPNNPKHYRKARTPYSALVAGVVSTKPGILLGNRLGGGLRAAALAERQQSQEPELALSWSLVQMGAGTTLLSGVSVALLAPYWSAGDERPLLALVGRVPVKASTDNGPIQIGDLLTSSSKAGYAMRCADAKQCEGAIIGKALESLEQGTGVILMLVMR
jgi:hypothetical protein